MGDYKINNLYQPGYSSFKPGATDAPMHAKGFSVPASQMGITVNPGVANQLAELNKALNQGVVPVELGTISWDLWESIPEEHFHEMRRKAALAEAKLSIHAPIQGMDPSGFGEKGWDASQQKLVENQLKDVVNKASIIDKSGNMPITIHGSNYAGSTWKYAINPETGKREKMYDQMIAVDKKTGQAIPIKEDVMFRPGGNFSKEDKGNIMTPEEGLKSHNNSQWRKEVNEVVYKNEAADKILKDIGPAWNEIVAKVDNEITSVDSLKQTEKDIYFKLKNADAHIYDAELGVNSLFNKAVEYSQGDAKKMEIIQKLSNQYAEAIGGITQEKFDKLDDSDKKLAIQKQQELQYNLHAKSEAIQTLAEGLREVRPEMFVTVEQFSIEKASETFANVAKYSYDKNGEGAPVISIENLDQGRMGFSNGEDLAKLSATSREKFRDKLMNEGKSFSEAGKIADKMIGVTFDVGHLNISRKYGFEKEDLIKEAEALKGHVKHIHLTDNFGYADSHLPIGMGNVPVKELLDALGDEGREARKINEVGGWFQISQESPFPHLLQASGSQVYSSGSGPSWSQNLGFQQSYSQGGGMMLPSTHYSMFGAGFSQLPTELGGSVGGAGGAGRMGGGGF